MFKTDLLDTSASHTSSATISWPKFLDTIVNEMLVLLFCSSHYSLEMGLYGSQDE